jgi:hypothetical protein
MALSFATRDMIGTELADAIDAAQARLSDETITARCANAEWLIERDGAPVAEGLTYDEAVAAATALE